ncbi:MAG: GDP-mannose 4,6-dehydratase [Flavobacteriaceae bacterium]|nr:GDP-mannose 4,6-dehydratase [Flavobacteriaceae bacterium]|tara:strand:- start:486 stop:1478 length:993 start_codon:yes stop_codon:yes gene_type:complete
MSNNQQKTALVTGATGQDGSYLVDLLLSKGYHVVAVKRRTSLINTDRIDHVFENYKLLENFTLVYGNMIDSGNIHRILMEFMPDEIYNLAAQSHVKVSFQTPEETAEIVGMGALKLLEAVRNVCPQARVYQASSSEMFGDNPENPQSETTQLMPASPYACAKVFAHNLCNNYRESYNMHISSGILFNHESPRRGETFVTRKITQAAAKIKMGLQDKLYLGNLDAKRDWGYAADYVEAMWLMLQQDEPDDYVIATGETHSVKQFLEEVFDYAGLNIDEHVEIDTRLFRPHEVPLLLGDPSKAKEKLGWEPKIKFKELARLMYDADLKNLIK